MSRTERLLELMVVLRARGLFTVQEMADELGVSRRTMLRDLHALSAIGVPLSATPGPGGGYTLAYPHGGRAVSLLLSADEAIGLVLSYEALLQHAQSPFGAQGVSAVTKLRAAMPPDVVRDLDRLRERVAMVTVGRAYDAPHLTEILRAALDGVHLRVLYDSRGGRSGRLIYPYGLYAALGFWYCACFDYKRGRHASLRADRVASLERVEGLERPEALTLQEWLRRPPAGEGETLRLRARITPRGMKIVDWSAFGGALVEDADGGGRVDMDVPVSSLDHYARLFLQLGPEAAIESPPQLIAGVRERAQAVLTHYDVEVLNGELEDGATISHSYPSCSTVYRM